MRAHRLSIGLVMAALSTLVVRVGAMQPAQAVPSPAVAEDRYALAGVCWAVQSLVSGRYIVRSGEGFAATAATVGASEPFFFKATDLGSYMMFGSARDYFAAGEGLIGQVLDTATQNTAGGLVEGLSWGASTAAADTVANGPAGTATGRGAGIVSAAKATELADWEIQELDAASYSITLAATVQRVAADADGTLRLVNGTPTGPDTRFNFEPATGCAQFPEVEVNIDGPIAKGSSPDAEVRGFLDAHVHMMAFEFIGGRVRCGRPWHRYGVEHALVDCPDHEPGGAGAVLEQLLSGGPGLHDTAGWPTFPYWPKSNSLTHEQIYYKWLERSWRGGLRLMVNLMVDNAALCNVYPYRSRASCNEMDGVRLQVQRIRELERYIDAQSGGPGEGWFRIVTDPVEARHVINDGKLAVVLGIEVSTPLDCGLAVDLPLCDTQKIDRELDAVYDLGVRQMEMGNKFDNALTGITGDPGVTGVVVNSGNFQQTGQFWRMKTCDDVNSPAHDHQQLNVHDDATRHELTGRDSIFAGVLEVAGSSGAAPAYPPGPHCNVRGLSPLGEHFLRGIKARGMIFDPDHMGALARKQALDFMATLGDSGYSGLVSSHSWADDTIYPRVIEGGGVVTPHAGGSTGFLGKWRKQRGWADPRYYFGIGFGSDVNGFSAQGSPRGANAPNKVTYPFTGFGGVSINKQVSGQRTYDVNTDGVAHYGLYPDWIEDIRRQAGADGAAFIEDMSRGAEAYLQMWERATGLR